MDHPHLVRGQTFRNRLNVGKTKFYELIRNGYIPPPTKLPMANGEPGGVSFWSNAVVDACVARLANPRNASAIHEIINSRGSDPFGRNATNTTT